MIVIRLFLIVSVFLISACVQNPTLVKEDHKNNFWILQSQLSSPLKINDKTIVIDVRSAFDYNVYHVNGSLHFQVRDFYTRGKNQKYSLKRNKSKLIQRIALKGIEQETPVIVLDKGVGEKGEASQVAWALINLGLENVQVAHVELFKKHFTQRATKSKENKPAWVYKKPKLQEKIKDLKFIIDIRESKNYLESPTKSFKSQVVNIPWREFYNGQGRPRKAIKSQLKAIGIRPEDGIKLMGGKGLYERSVAYALLSLGYEKLVIQ